MELLLAEALAPPGRFHVDAPGKKEIRKKPVARSHAGSTVLAGAVGLGCVLGFVFLRSFSASPVPGWCRPLNLSHFHAFLRFISPLTHLHFPNAPAVWCRIQGAGFHCILREGAEELDNEARSILEIIKSRFNDLSIENLAPYLSLCTMVLGRLTSLTEHAGPKTFETGCEGLAVYGSRSVDVASKCSCSRTRFPRQGCGCKPKSSGH